MFRSQGKGRIALAALAVGAFGTAGGSQAAEFRLGDADITFNNVISTGMSIRAERPDPEFAAPGNLPGGQASSNAFDDGSLNFGKGEIVSSTVRLFSELKLDFGDFGAVVSGKAWYDHELSEGKRDHGSIAGGYGAGRHLDDSGFANLARFSGVALLDAYVRGSLDVGDMPLELRAGRQVVSWGESTFIPGGINVINPVDVNAFRRPGAELKEGLLPVGMAYGNLGLTPDLSLEAFYQFEWLPTEIDGCGTFFSTVDALAKGCNTFTLGTGGDAATIAGGVTAKRAPDLKPEDTGQFGFALRYFWQDLDVELGAYFLNYHSRLPFISAYKTTAANGATPFIPGDPRGGNPRYVAEYPEDIQLYGVSFATVIGGVSVSGEVSYRPEQPVQYNASDIIAAAVSGGTAVDTPISAVWRGMAAGELLHGYDKLRQTHAQVTAFKTLPPALGAAGITLIGEAGLEVLGNMSDTIRYGRSSVFGIAAYGGACRETTAKKCANDGYVSDFSWGYRARAVFDYPGVYAGINAKPFVSWSHDVDGYSADGTFAEGRIGLGLGVDLDYQGYSVGASYTTFSGGDYTYGHDRDFFALSATARF
ncbi:uncharacterized protein DUF1302 [Zavarzinia compransoris]|nr:uncharacterized protein DUF1302 [Zavarzinia compransoris]